jgi:hypothetical protein
MGGDVVDALALDIDLAAVAQALEIFGAGERPVLAGDDVLGLRFAHDHPFLVVRCSADD